MIKKLFLYFMMGSLVSLVSCGGGSSKSETENASEQKESETKEGKIYLDSSDNSQEYNEFLSFSSEPSTINVNGHMLEVEVSPLIKKAANKINDNDNTELILLDESGNQLKALHPFGRDTAFEDALYNGDTSFSGKWTFIASTDTDDEARTIANKAKKYRVIVPLADRVIKVNKYPNWNPQGTYQIEDANGSSFTLIIKKGGSAELINNDHANTEDYKPTKGSWSQSKDEGFVELDFFSGPFIRIGSHDYFTRPILTPDYIYYDDDAYEEDSDCLEVKKID